MATKDSFDIFNIAGYLIEISDHVMSSLKTGFERFGIELVDFFIQDISTVIKTSKTNN